MKKKNFIYGIFGLTLGFIISFFILNPFSSQSINGKGSMHELKKKTNPCKVYTVGEWLESLGNIEPDQHITYSTSKDCDYILRNVGGLTISSGTSAKVLFEIIAENGSQYIELAIPIN